MNQHLFALLPMSMGTVLLAVTCIAPSILVAATGGTLLIWGVTIHANSLASFRKNERKFNKQSPSL